MGMGMGIIIIRRRYSLDQVPTTSHLVKESYDMHAIK
jgi:hypothetical protein